LGEEVPWVEIIGLPHQTVSGYFGHNRRRSNGVAKTIALDYQVKGQRAFLEVNKVQQQVLRLDGETGYRPQHGSDIGLTDAYPVDLLRAFLGHADSQSVLLD
jgi:hypothetical protein